MEAETIDNLRPRIELPLGVRDVLGIYHYNDYPGQDLSEARQVDRSEFKELYIKLKSTKNWRKHPYGRKELYTWLGKKGIKLHGVDMILAITLAINYTGADIVPPTTKGDVKPCLERMTLLNVLKR